MGLYQTKFWFRQTFGKMTKYLITVDPDLLSYLAVMVSGVTGVCLYYFPYNTDLLIAAFVLILLRMALNTFDGMIAIAQNKKTMIGEIVNALPDRYSDILVMLGLVLCPLTNTPLGVIAVISMGLVSYTGMLGKAVEVSWQHQGPLGKVDRLVALMIAIVLQYLINQRIIPIPFDLHRGVLVFDILMVWFILGAQITVYNRVRGMATEIRTKEKYSEGIKGVIVYDSRTGNTKKVARTVSAETGFDLFAVDEAPSDLGAYDILVLGTLNIRAEFSSKLGDFIDRTVLPERAAVFVTYGMPVWGPVSTFMLFSRLEKRLANKGSACVRKFMCPGFHAKYKKYPGRPDQRDLKKAERFARSLVG
jgi:phosphatidylglycerophosphate synthase/flavodoxin